MDYVLNFSVVWRSFDHLLGGLGLSLLLALGSILIGMVIGLVVSFALISPLGIARNLAGAYVTVTRNTPLLVLVLFTYFALPDLGVRLGDIESFVATLAIYSGGYLAEVFRAGMLSVPKGLSGAGDRAHEDADPFLDHHANHVPQCSSCPRQHRDLAVQGYVARGGDCCSRAYVPSAQDQCGELSRRGDLDHCQPPLCLHLRRPRHVVPAG
jgi:His/Glu/Gln/Arg/opine family amino acid ABC transporter permease subunit